MKEGEGKSMCDLLDEAENRGIQKGIQRELISLVKQGLLKVDDAARQLSISVKEFEKKMNESA